ncbi:chorismate synthase [Spirochaetia bacterium]|nr:chorismate synthase [Spirochaetia bacterium]
MAGNIMGTLFRVVTFGESHGAALGCVVDGCPAGLELCAEDIAVQLRRRRPGGGGAATTRSESDEPEILSGLFEGKTLGTPIAVIVRNTGARSADYEALRDVYRPGHADWTWEVKYGRRDHRGGGRSSGRETAARVAAGAIAAVFLSRFGITVRSWTASAAGISAPLPGEAGFDLDEAEKNPLRMPNREAADRASAEMEKLRAEGDSAGGIACCRVEGLPPGLGEPVFDKIDALLAQAMLSLGAAKGIEFGAGFNAPLLRGSQNNDTPAQAQKIHKSDRLQGSLPPGVPAIDFTSNNAGGVLGGMSNGAPLEFRVAFKPVPSIAKPQKTVGRDGAVQEITIAGRHDVCIVPRAVPVVEAMTALVLADLMLLQGYKI